MERNGAESDNIINRGANLKDLIIRPITPGEENEWNILMAKHHYLGFHCLSGRRLKYVALLDGRWVALIDWGAAALKCSPRDRWINWSKERKYERRKSHRQQSAFSHPAGCLHQEPGLQNTVAECQAAVRRLGNRLWTPDPHGGNIRGAQPF